MSLRRVAFWLVLAVSFAIVVPSPAAGQTSTPRGETKLRWYKGNTHTHTLNSDGDSTPDDVVRWYREHGYGFLVLTDHNFLTSVEALNALAGADGKFLVIPGEEVTDRFGEKPIHVNGLNLDRLVEPQGGRSVTETIQRNVDAVRGVRGVPHVNHPNFSWAISIEDLAPVRRYKLLEIFNGHPLVNNQGGGGVPSLEKVWDAILSSAHIVYGIAVDDAHDFKRPWDPKASRPGRGWVMVRASRLTAADILDAMERGDFYASTGVELEDYSVDDRRMTIRLKPRADEKFRVLFIGKNGTVLKEAVDNPAVYEFTGQEGYVRAKIVDSNGLVAWTQPHVVSK